MAGSFAVTMPSLVATQPATAVAATAEATGPPPRARDRAAPETHDRKKTPKPTSGAATASAARKTTRAKERAAGDDGDVVAVAAEAPALRKRKVQSWHSNEAKQHIRTAVGEWFSIGHKNTTFKDFARRHAIPVTTLRDYCLADPSKQRSVDDLRSSTTLTREDVQQLCAASLFSREIRRSDASFEDRVEALKAYKANRGHVNVRSNEGNLYTFCLEMRKARKTSRETGLDKEGIVSLDALGFDWGFGYRVTQLFEDGLQALKVFKAKHGHVNVSHNNNSK